MDFIVLWDSCPVAQPAVWDRHTHNRLRRHPSVRPPHIYFFERTAASTGAPDGAPVDVRGAHV